MFIHTYKFDTKSVKHFSSDILCMMLVPTMNFQCILRNPLNKQVGEQP